MQDPTTAPIVDTLATVLSGAQRAGPAVTAMLRAHPEWDNAQRAAAARAVLAISSLRARLFHGVPRSPSAGARELLACWWVLQCQRDVQEVVQQTGLTASWLRALAWRWPPQGLARMAAQASLPLWLTRAWHGALGADPLMDLAACLNAPGPMVLRVNTLQWSRADAQAHLQAQGIPTVAGIYSPWALEVQGRAPLRTLHAWKTGGLEVQDQASQCVALLSGAAPGMSVVDWCAGRGGKTLALAAMMAGSGTLWAADPHAPSLADLRARLVRARLAWVQVAQHPWEPQMPADLVVVDAPCSATGTLRRTPDLRWHVSPTDVANAAALQLDILKGACRFVAPGGLLLYATCALQRHENHDVAQAFAAAHPAFQPSALPLPRGLCADSPEGHTVTFWPHQTGTDGFFVARFRRRG